MTVRSDIRMHFEREAVRVPVPPSLRASAAAEARRRASERPSHQWVPALVAAILALAIIAGLVAVNAVRTGPVPVAPPRALFHDNLSAPASGRPSLADRTDFVHIDSYALAASLPATPDQRYAFAIDRSLSPSPESVQHAFGINDTPQADGSGAYVIGTIRYFPGSGAMYISVGIYAQYKIGKFVHAITSDTAAIPLAAEFLVSHGLFTQGELDGMHASKRRVVSATNPTLWFIEFDRTVGGLRDYGPSQPGAVVEALDDGTVWGVAVMRHPIAGSMQARVVSGAQAWAQVKMGHWYAADGFIDNGRIDLPAFKADSVELCYREGDVNEAQSWLVPMWCFADTTSFTGVTLRLYYPALVPGTFDWTAPNR
jgi:hypothetical protein